MKKALASAAPLLHGLVVGPFTWSLLRLLNGFSLAVLYVVIESWLNEHATNDNRAVVFSTYAMITLSVLAAGQMMTLLYDPTGLQLFAIASVLISVAAIPVALSSSPSPTLPKTAAVDLRGACWGAAAFPLYTIAVAHANDYADPSQYVTVSGGLLLMYGIGATVGPIIAAIFLTATNTDMLFLYCLIVHLLLAGFVLYRGFVQRAPSDHPVPFADALAVTQTASPVYEDEIAQDSHARQETTTGHRARHGSHSHAHFSGMSFFNGKREESQ